MEGGDEADDDSLALEPEDQPVLLPSATLDVQTAVQIEDQLIILPSTHPGLAENQESATNFVQQIQAGQATVHIPSTHEDLSQPIGSEPVIDLNIQDYPAPEQYVYVLGVATKVYISKQLLLNEITSKLGLVIHSSEVKVEGTDQYRANLNMDLPRAGIRKKKNIAIEDINYNSLISTERKLHRTKQMLDMFAHSLELQRNEGHLLQQKYNMLVNQINKICAQSTSYLPIHVDGWDNQDGQTNDISATYIGRSPPLTSNEILAKKLIALTQYKRDRSSFLPT
uniref:Uncharacterized protein n=1 Tax=Oryza glumipatula TaxID=40148 RepID=A0A0E0B1M5_9ORYZ